MIEIIECPHCFARVVPKSDNTCPSCRKNIKDMTNADTDLTTVTLGPSATMPELCIICGQQTNRTYKYTMEIPGGQDSKLISTLLSLLRGRLLSGLIKKQIQSIGIKLPVCNNCKHYQANIKPIHFNKDTDTMTFVVHKAFKKGIEILKERGDS